MRKKSMLIILLTVSVLMPAFAGINYGQCVTEAANLVAGGLKTTSKVAFVSMDSDSDSFSRKFISDVERALVNQDFIVLDRSNTDAMIKELEFQTSGMVDDREAVSIGHMLGADMIIAGRAKNMVSHYEVEIQLIELETSLLKRHGKYELEYDSQLRNIIRGATDAVGNQNIGVTIKIGSVFGFNKAHESMVNPGEGGIAPGERSRIAFAPSLAVYYRFMNVLKIQIGMDYIIGNGLHIDELGDTSWIDVEYDTIDIPLLLMWNFIQEPISADIYAGGYVSLPVGKTLITQNNGSASLDMKGPVFGVAAGATASYKLGPGHALIDFRFINDFGTMKALVGVPPEWNEIMYRKSLIVSAGYSINLF